MLNPMSLISIGFIVWSVLTVLALWNSHKERWSGGKALGVCLLGFLTCIIILVVSNAFLKSKSPVLIIKYLFDADGEVMKKGLIILIFTAWFLLLTIIPVFIILAIHTREGFKVKGVTKAPTLIISWRVSCFGTFGSWIYYVEAHKLTLSEAMIKVVRSHPASTQNPSHVDVKKNEAAGNVKTMIEKLYNFGEFQRLAKHGIKHLSTEYDETAKPLLRGLHGKTTPFLPLVSRERDIVVML